MELKIDHQEVIELAAKKIADAIMYDDNGIEQIAKREIEARIERVFKERADAAVSAAIDAAVGNALDREYRRINAWGEADGTATTIRKELEKLADGYWTQKVDARTGKVTDNSYNSVTRAQYVMTQVCAEDFTAQMKQAAVSATAALKDGFRKQLAGHVDNLLNELFRVQSMQDQDKASKPW